MKALTTVAGALVIVGGLNWGLVAIGEFDLVAWLAGEAAACLAVVAVTRGPATAAMGSSRA
jgi:uncharacterized membrane protein YuzA (DUF378 family)